MNCSGSILESRIFPTVPERECNTLALYKFVNGIIVSISVTPVSLQLRPRVRRSACGRRVLHRYRGSAPVTAPGPPPNRMPERVHGWPADISLYVVDSVEIGYPVENFIDCAWATQYSSLNIYELLIEIKA